MNPFLKDHFGTKHNTIPFHELSFEDYETAFMEGIKREKEEIQKIIDNSEVPTFENTIIPKSDETLGKVSNAFFALLNACTSDEMDALAQKMAPILTEHGTSILLNPELFKRIKYVHENHRELNAEEQLLLDHVYEGFEKNGANLSVDDKEKFNKLSKELSRLTLQFSQNCLKETNSFELHITDRNLLKGLPESSIEAANVEAKEKGKIGWLFTLHAPSYGPFMTYSENQELRHQMYMARNTICIHGNDQDNQKMVTEIVNLRRQIAQILGYKSYADYVLPRRMAENKENVYRLLKQLLDSYMPQAKEELRQLQAFAKEIEGDDFEMAPWDFSFYCHKLKMQRYNIDAEMLRPYFQLSKVKEGIFDLAQKLYGISFRLSSDIQVYHPDIEVYEVLDKDGSFLAVLYIDLFPRSNKQSGAWMTNFLEQHKNRNGEDVRPHVSLVMNFTKPTPEKPALLTLGEVETFLHEFGHALHSIFSKVRFESLSGTNVYWDFVELPSQFMENYAFETEFLKTFARHYKTDEAISEEYLQRIQASRNFFVANECIRQVSLAMLDMAYYTMEENFDEDIRAFERKVTECATLYPRPEETCISVQFSHIMCGGYAAGYYSYKWAEVLDADAFGFFKEKGIFDAETAERFRECILSKGGTDTPINLYKKFRGKEPSINALLDRDHIKIAG